MSNSTAQTRAKLVGEATAAGYLLGLNTPTSNRERVWQVQVCQQAIDKLDRLMKNADYKRVTQSRYLTSSCERCFHDPCVCREVEVAIGA